jgi:hypothetical protein
MLGKPLWVVTDGAYASAPFLKPMRTLAVTVVSRLRKDANLRTVPAGRSGKPGRPRMYGEHRIDLAKRGGQTRGWVTGTFTLYGKATVKRYKTFVATWRPAGGAIRVVLVDEPTGWAAFFCTDTAASVADILGAVANRFSLDIDHPNCHPSNRVSAPRRAGYDRGPGAADPRPVVPAAARVTPRRSPMPGRRSRPAPPRPRQLRRPRRPHR